jgi:hypothetical protein
MKRPLHGETAQVKLAHSGARAQIQVAGIQYPVEALHGYPEGIVS